MVKLRGYATAEQAYALEDTAGPPTNDKNEKERKGHAGVSESRLST